MNMDETIKELQFAKDHGACGILKKGDLEAGKWPADPYFFPLYEEANRLDLPICVHIGSGTPDFVPAREFSLGSFMRSQLPTVHAFHTIIRHQLPVKYPKLRFGIIEAGCSWIPFIAWELKRRMEKAADVPQYPRRHLQPIRSLHAVRAIYSKPTACTSPARSMKTCLMSSKSPAKTA